jgi:hypothetical protein
MGFERRLNLHIEVEGLGSRHYNTHVNLKLNNMFVMVWSSQNLNLLYGQHVGTIDHGNY